MVGPKCYWTIYSVDDFILNILIFFKGCLLRNQTICKCIFSSGSVVLVLMIIFEFSFFLNIHKKKKMEANIHLKNAFHFVRPQSTLLVTPQFRHVWHEASTLERQESGLCSLESLFAWLQIPWPLNLWIFRILLLISVTSLVCVCEKDIRPNSPNDWIEFPKWEWKLVLCVKI